MNFIDFHCDTASILYEKKKSLKENDLKVDIKKLKDGKALAQFFALFINKKNNNDTNDYCIKMLKNFKMELEINKEDIILCRNFNDYKEAINDKKIGAFLTIEEGDAIGYDLNNIKYFKKQGVSLITLTWNYENRLGYPNFEFKFKDRGLTNFGVEAIKEMNNQGIIIDVSHLSDRGFYDAIKHSKKPIVASHSNARYITNHFRNLDDKMIKLLANKGGVTGINFCSEFLGESNVSRILDMVNHIKHLKNIGGIDVIALGSDFDGISNEVEISDASKIGLLHDALLNSGFKENEIEKIFYKNIERIIKDVL